MMPRNYQSQMNWNGQNNKSENIHPSLQEIINEQQRQRTQVPQNRPSNNEQNRNQNGGYNRPQNNGYNRPQTNGYVNRNRYNQPYQQVIKREFSAVSIQGLLFEQKHKAFPTWKERFEAFKDEVHKYYDYVFVQELASKKLVHLQFMNQQVVSSCSPNSLRQRMEQTPHKNQSLTVDIESSQIVHQFEEKAYVYDINEKENFLSEIWRFGIKGTKIRQYDTQCIKIQKVPSGIYFQMRYYNGEWCFASKTLARINESTFGGQETFETLVKQQFAANKLSFEDLNKECGYTFILQHKQMIPDIESIVAEYKMKSQLFLLAVFNFRLHKSQKEDRIRDFFSNVQFQLLPITFEMTYNKQYYKPIDSILREAILSLPSEEYFVSSINVVLRSSKFEINTNLGYTFNKFFEQRKDEIKKNLPHSDFQTFVKSQDKDNVIRILLQKECDGFEIINEEEIKESPVIQPKEETMVPTRALEEAKVPKRDLEEIKVPKRDLEEVKVYRRDLEDLRTHRPDLEESKEQIVDVPIQVNDSETECNWKSNKRCCGELRICDITSTVVCETHAKYLC